VQILAEAGLFAVADFQNFVFQSTAIGDVFGNADDANAGAGAVADGKGTIANPAECAVGADDAVFLAVFAGGLFDEGLGDAVAIFGVNGIQPAGDGGIEVTTVAAPDFFVGGADVDHAGVVGVAHPEGVGDVFRELAELLHGFAKLLFGLFAFLDFEFEGGGAVAGALFEFANPIANGGNREGGEEVNADLQDEVPAEGPVEGMAGGTLEFIHEQSDEADGGDDEAGLSSAGPGGEDHEHEIEQRKMERRHEEEICDREQADDGDGERAADGFDDGGHQSVDSGEEAENAAHYCP